MARKLCRFCYGRGWIIDGGRKKDCPNPVCDNGYVGTDDDE
jgi:hypothetical protein